MREQSSREDLRVITLTVKDSLPRMRCLFISGPAKMKYDIFKSSQPIVLCKSIICCSYNLHCTINHELFF